MFLSPEVKAFAALSPITKLPVAPDNPAGILIKKALSFVKSMLTSLNPFKSVAPPPPAACKVILPVEELYVKTSPFDALLCKPGILNDVTAVFPKVISFVAVAELASASYPIIVKLLPEVIEFPAW